MERHVTVLPVLNEIQNLLNSQPDINKNLRTIFDGSKKLIEFDYFGILIKTDEKKNFSFSILVPEDSFNSKLKENDLIQWIFKRKSSYLSGNVKTEKKIKYKYLTLARDEKSFIGTPLTINNKVSGVFFMLSKNLNAYSEVDRIIFENIAGMIASCIIKFESCKAIISKIKEINNDLHAELRDTRKVVEKIIHYAIELTHADHGCLVHYYFEQNRLECKYLTQCKMFNCDKKQGCIFDIDNDTNNLLVEVFTEQKGKTVDNIENEGYVSIIKNTNGNNIQSQIALPLFGKSKKAIGVLLLESIYLSHFSRNHLDILETISEFGITAFNDSRLIRKLEKLSEASNVLLNEYEKMPLLEKFDFIVAKTVELLDAELCTLFLVQEGKLHLITSYEIDINSKGRYPKMRKRKKEERIVEIEYGERTGHTGAIAYKKVVYNEYGESLRKHPAAKNPDDTKWLPSNFNYSELAYPMLDDGEKLLGLFLAHNKRDETGKPLENAGFSKEFDEPLMRILTSKLILSIKNAELVNQLSNSLNQLKNYAMIIESTPDPVAISTIRGLITYMNEGAINLFGDLIGKKVYDYYYTDDTYTGMERAKDIMHKLYKSTDGRIKNIETVFTNKEGNPIPVSLSASLIRKNTGEIVGTIGIAKDLREIKTLLEVGNSLLSNHEPGKILKIICDECLKLPKSIRAYIKLHNKKSNYLYFRELSSRNPEDELPTEPFPINRGKTGLVFQTQKPYFAGDVTKDSSEEIFKIFADVKSKIIVPISSVDKKTGELKKLGVISVDSNELHAFTLNDIHFLSTIATQAANALENAHLITSQKKVINELSALEMVRHAITETRNFDEILESTLDAVTKILGFDYATISEVKYDLKMIGTVKGRNVPKKWLDLAWHSLDSDDIQAWVVRNKREVKLMGWDERLDRKIYNEFEHEKLVRIFIPILVRGDVLGTLETGYHKANKDDIEQEEIEILRRVVNLAGIGIEQVNLINKQENLLNQLKADLELRNELEKQLQALNQASIKLLYSRTEEDAINHIFICLESIGYNKGMLSLVNEETNMIEGKYALGDNWKKILQNTKRPLNSHDILAIAIRKKKPILSKDCKSDPRCSQDAIQKAGIRSQYIIPMIVNDKGIGTLQIDLSDKQELVFGDEVNLIRRMNVLETFASQSAIAIKNTRDMSTIDFLETSLAETAHEFRSPLHNIITEIGGLKDYLESKYEKDEEEIDDIMLSISEQAQRAKRQMENTLLLSDKSKSLMGFNFESAYIQDIIESCVSSYRVRALERGISIIIRDNIKKLPKFHFDKQKMEQVLTNLIDNAVKYSHYNRKIQISGFDDGRWINIEVQDRGLGIPELEYINVFKGFTRSKIKDRTRYIPGTGIGLKISNQIVEGHGGAIKVKSIPVDANYKKRNDYSSFDTTFIVILPKKPKEKQYELQNFVHRG